jgi:hypothetical protein
MRQVNRPVHPLARPVEVMVPNVYNRPALDVTSTLPLSITLTNLRPMIFNLKRTREVMTHDGGLEALIDISSTIRDPDDPTEELNRKIALQCLNRIGICGPEAVRIRSVEAQILPVLISKLECFWRAMEPEIRHGIYDELYPPLLPKPVSADHEPPQALPRRRALTTGSSSIQMVLSGLRIITAEQVDHPIPEDHPQSPANRRLDIAPRMERLVQEVVAAEVVTEASQQPMEIDCEGTNEVDNESGLEDPTAEVEPLRSPHSEPQRVPFGDPFAGPASDHTDPSLVILDGPTMLQTQVEVSSASSVAAADPISPESALHPQTSPEPEPERSVTDNAISTEQRLADLAIPPNAPLLGHTVPGAPLIPHAVPRRRPQRIAIVPSQVMSVLYSRSNSSDLHVPTREEILDCLECLAQLSKLPKLRPYLICTRLVPNMLHDRLRGEDQTKQVNVFEIVERFTVSNYHPEDVRRWAQVVMRHYSRKDTVMTHRQCGNFRCCRMESEIRRFILCPVCK